MKTNLLILYLSFIPILLNGQSKYSYQEFDSYDEYLKNLPLFWSHVTGEVKEIKSDSLPKEIIKEKKLLLLENLGKWSRNYEHLSYKLNQNQKNERDSITVYYLSSINYSIRQLKRFLEEDLDNNDFAQIYIQISQYKPAPNADTFLNNFETFIRKNFTLNLPYRVEEYYFYELHVLQSDIDKYEPMLDEKQKNRLEKLFKLFEDKRKKWEQKKRKRNKSSYIEVKGNAVEKL